MEKQTILVTGGNGVVGSYVASTFPGNKVVSTTKKTMDVSDKIKVFKTIEKYKPNIIIHLAANTNVDACEKDPKTAENIHAKGTKYVAQAARKIGAIVEYV